MSETKIFVIGLGTFILLLGGVLITAYEMRRLYEPGTTKK